MLRKARHGHRVKPDAGLGAGSYAAAGVCLSPSGTFVAEGTAGQAVGTFDDAHTIMLRCPRTGPSSAYIRSLCSPRAFSAVQRGCTELGEA